MEKSQAEPAALLDQRRTSNGSGSPCRLPHFSFGPAEFKSSSLDLVPASATKRQRPMSSTPLSGLTSKRDDAMEAVADMEAGPETSRITHLFAGVPVSDLDASIDWYTRLFGRPPDRRVGHEMLWEMDEHAWLFIEPNATQAGAGRITLAVSGLDALLARVAVEGIEHEPVETYSNGVRHVKIPDPDGNAIAFAEPPDAT